VEELQPSHRVGTIDNSCKQDGICTKESQILLST
jgi:hypothetical protein